MHQAIACALVATPALAYITTDEWSRFAWTFPMKKKSQSARLLALLVLRINT